MDRRVKERLIGASILVAIAVLVVPELLSGPKTGAPPPALPAPAAITPEPIRNVTVDLATSKAPPTSDPEPPAAPPLPASRTAAGAESSPSATASAPQARDASGPGSEASARAEPATPVETPRPSPISTAHWAVQLGSFANRANAENLVRQLKGQGLTANVSSVGSGQSVRFRVRMGPFADRPAAERTAARLKSLKHDSTIVGPGL